ncbi:MAG: hypothetical protein IPK52_25085 [Chloroflexi bacterium]|nr:hypothetical protein [Chloroflexota bacterium]
MSAPEAPAPGLGLYYLAIYIRGAKWSPEVTDFVRETQDRHLAYNDEMYRKGHYKLVGPFHQPHDSRWRGIILMKAESMEQASAFMDGDPAVQAGRLAYEISSLWLGKETVGD